MSTKTKAPVQMTVVDGTGEDAKAPRPGRKGWTQALYDVVEANRGWSSLDDIRKLLPAAIDDERLLPEKKLSERLRQAIYQGYLIEHNGRYAVAPRPYYDARREVILEQQNKHLLADRKPTKRKAHPADSFVFIRPLWHWSVLVGMFAAGLACGGLLALLII